MGHGGLWRNILEGEIVKKREIEENYDILEHFPQIMKYMRRETCKVMKEFVHGVKSSGCE